jgi:hypothetical protein
MGYFRRQEAVVLTLSQWLPPALVGASFTAVGVLKLYGLHRGIVGGESKPFAERLCGT